MIILGLDPSLRAYGWAIVDRPDVGKSQVLKCGCICTEKDAHKKHVYAADQMQERIERLADGLTHALLATEQLAGGGFARVVAEAPSGSQNSSAAAALGHVAGMTIGVLHSKEHHLVRVQPHEVKLAVGGAKGASKDAVAAAVRLRCNSFAHQLEGCTAAEREAIYDAIAVALTPSLRGLR